MSTMFFAIGTCPGSASPEGLGRFGVSLAWPSAPLRSGIQKPGTWRVHAVAASSPNYRRRR
jgi:hypothetical protein